MFRIRRIYDDLLPINGEEIKQVQEILRTQFDKLPESDIVKLPLLLKNPLKYKFKTILFVADNGRGRVFGFSIVYLFTDFNFCYLDFISAAPNTTGRGIGGSLYDRVRESAKRLGAVGIFFECLPDDPALCKNENTLKQNAARLKFYERYGAFPIINTKYETPVKPDSDCPPYLVFDSLGNEKLPDTKYVKKMVNAILERKYGDVCSPAYTKMVVDSFKENPIKLRKPKYIKNVVSTEKILVTPEDLKIAIVLNDRHDIHHITERGYVEAPVRIRSIMKELIPTGLFKEVTVKKYPIKHITDVHAKDYVSYLEKVCANVPAKKSIYPYVFPIRNAARPPIDLPVRAGYYCMDTFTPLNQNAFIAAKRAVDCTLTAADEMLNGAYISYSLVRPPGHHAEKRAFGGFCYLNSNAVAAHYLSKFGKVCILDIDYHHGNGSQNIFYKRADVLTISIHGNPKFAYPYFSGFEDEIGANGGENFNVNMPLKENIDGKEYLHYLKKATKFIEAFDPKFLIIALGLDPAKDDPTGTWQLLPKDFEENGKVIGKLKIPTLVVQEGGYKIRSLGNNAKHFFTGLWNGFHN